MISRALVLYILKFLLCFCVLYFGTLGVIALSAREGYHSSVVENYLDYVSLLRASLLRGSELFLSILGFHTVVPDIYSLKLEGGRRVHIGFDCIGYGVMSFWGAFIFANRGRFIKKIKWLFGGVILIWVINILRISLLLLAINKNWPMPLRLDHHTWFNMAAYTCIFTLIYFFDRSGRPKEANAE